MTANSYVAANGQTYYRALFSGDGTVGSPIVPSFADTTAHTKIDLVRTDITALLPTALSGGRFQVVSTLTGTNANDYSSVGANVSAVIKASAGSLFSLTCTNLNANTRYLQIFNRTTVPTTGATPIRSFPVYANGGFLVIDQTVFGNMLAGLGLYCDTGIAWGFSTTALTYTAGTAADCIFSARWL